DVMHGSLLLGRGGDALVELAASWALVLVITGLYLWWPRGRRSRAFTFDRRTRGRKRWREIHRLVGVYTAVMIVFLIITGLPWASFWGDRVLSPVSNAMGLGYPPQLRHHGGGEASAEPVKTMVDTLGDAPWALQQAPLPHVHHHHGEHGGELDTSTAAINRVHDILAGQGLPYGYRLSIPSDAGDPYSAYTYPDRPQGQRTLHVDSGGHRLLVNVGFDDYGAIAKAV